MSGRSSATDEEEYVLVMAAKLVPRSERGHRYVIVKEEDLKLLKQELERLKGEDLNE